MSPDMNPIEHVWDFIGRKINQRNLKCQNIDELRTAILQEWQQFPQEWLRRLVRSMTWCVTELHNKRGGYTRYCFLCLTHTHTRGASTLSRYFWPVRLPSRTYKSNLVKGKTTPDSYTPTPKNSCAQNVVVLK
jgi:hypothetical protein